MTARKRGAGVAGIAALSMALALLGPTEARAESAPAAEPVLDGPAAEAQYLRLENGLRIVLQPNPASSVVAIAAFVQVTAAQESWAGAGIRELVQLMGQRTLARPERPAEGFPPVLRLHPSLSRDYVEMLALCLPEELPGALARLRAVLFEPRFDAERLRFGQQQLGRRVAERQSLALSAGQDLLVAQLYPQWAGSWPLVGTGAATGVDLDYVRRFHRQHYHANRTLLALSGPLSASQAQQQVAAVFGNLLPAAPPPPTVPPVRGPASRAGWVELALPGTTVAAALLGGRAPTLVDADYPATAVTLALLGNGRGSRLYRRLREEMGISYTIEAGVTPSLVCSYAYVAATCEPQDLPQVQEALMEELQALAADGPRVEELHRTRRALWGQWHMQQQDNRELAHYLGLFALLGGEQGPQQWRDLPLRLAAVSAEQVQQAARRLSDGYAAVAVSDRRQASVGAGRQRSEPSALGGTSGR